MTDINSQFQALARRQWWHARFCVLNAGGFVDVSFRVGRFGLAINRDHRSPRFYWRVYR